MAENPDESQGHTVITLCVVFGVSTTVVISLRLFARFYIIKTVGVDDVLITIASLLSWVFIAATIMAVNHGLGSHIDVVLLRGVDNLISYAQIVWFSSIFYNACLGFIKTSVLSLYMRLGDRSLTKMAIVMICVVSCQATANVLTCIFQCSPIKAAWDTTLTHKKCISINAFYLANAALNIATDLLTYTLPIKLVMKLQVPRNQKVALGVMLCLGLFACISSIIRITFIPQMLVSLDATWAITGAMYWSVIETNIGILAASIPSFKALAKRYVPVLLGEYSSKTRYPTTGAKPGPFHKISNGNSQTEALEMRPLSIKGGVNGSVIEVPEYEGGRKEFGASKNGVATKIGQDRVSNESEERLNVPDGRIVARTQITTQVEGADEGGSFYSHESEGRGQAQGVGRGL